MSNQTDPLALQAEATVGQTSSELKIRDGKIVRPGIWEGFNVYIAILAISFFFVAAAILLMFNELRQWGNPLSSPWLTNEAKIERAIPSSE